MARIRSVKPEFFTSETVAQLTVHARLTFIGLWTHVDDAGRALDNPRLLKAAVWPLDDDVRPEDVARHLDEFAKLGLICRYSVDSRRYLHVVNWDEHQQPKNPSKPKYPACPKQDHGGDGPGEALPPDYPSPTPDVGEDGESPSPPRARARSREQGAGSRGSASRVASATATPAATVTPIPTAQTFVAAYVDAYRGRTGHDPPSRVKGQLARELRTLLADGIPVEHVRAGFVEWFERDQHPSTLASFVEVEARGGQPRSRASPLARARTEDAKLARWAQRLEGGADGDPDRMAADRGQARGQLPRPGPAG
jgi:hypothetical protein